jgi:PAS domain S-box-containing protein
LITSIQIEAIFNAFPTECLVLLPDAPRFTIVSANEAFCRATCMASCDLIGKAIFEIIPNNPGARWEPEMRDCLAMVIASKVARQMDLLKYGISIQGTGDLATRYWNSKVSPILNAAGEVELLLCTSSDVTEQAARDLTEKRKGELEMSLLVNNTEESFLLLDKDLKIVSFNQQFLTLMESHFGRVVKKGDQILEHTQLGRREVVRTIYEKVLRGEEITTELPVSDGSLLIYCLKYKPTRDEKSNIIGAFVTMKDVTEAARVKAELEHNEAKFRAFFENSMDGILLTVPDGRILSANPAACTLFQMTEAEICEAGRRELVDTADPSLNHLLLERRAKGKAKGEITFFRKDGSKFPAEVSSAIFIDAYGEERTSMIIRDITEHKKAEAAIQQGIQRFNYVTQATSDAIWDWDLCSETTYWGEGFQTIFGYSPQGNEVDRNKWIDRIHPDDVERILKEIYQVVDGTELNWAGEYRYLKADKTYAFVADRGFVIRDKQGKATRMVGAMQDITKRKNDEFALQQSESRLRGIIASQTNYILRIDLAGNYSYYNQKFMDDFGWIHDEVNLIGINSKESIMAYHYPRVVETAEKCLANLNEVFQVEIDKPAKNGGIKTTFWDFICLTDSEGQPTEIQCIGIDITDKKKAERDIISTLEEKNTILESIGDAFFAVDSNWIVTYWNRQAENMLKTPKTEIVGKHLWGIFSDSIDSVSYIKYHEAIDTKQAILFEDYYPSLAKWYEVSVYPSDMGLSVYFKDVTERKHQTNALKLSEQRFKALVQEGTDLISILDEKRHYKYLSPAYNTILGLQLGEMTGTKALDRIHEEDLERVVQTSALLQTHKRVQYLPYRYRAGDDQYRWLESVATNLVDDPAIEGILYNSKDITERINYIQAIEEQNTKLREIAWIQSHLVRSPVSRILGLIDLMKNYQDKTDATELLEHIHDSAQELDLLIRNIVDKTQKIDL